MIKHNFIFSKKQILFRFINVIASTFIRSILARSSSILPIEQITDLLMLIDENTNLRVIMVNTRIVDYMVGGESK